jgi:hypothetical protein
MARHQRPLRGGRGRCRRACERTPLRGRRRCAAAGRPHMYEDKFTRGRVGLGQGVILQGAKMALWSKYESQETSFTEAGNAGVVGTPCVC